MLNFLTTVFGQNMGRLSFDLTTHHSMADVTFHVLSITFDGKQCISVHLDELPKIDVTAMRGVADRLAAIQADLV